MSRLDEAAHAVVSALAERRQPPAEALGALYTEMLDRARRASARGEHEDIVAAVLERIVREAQAGRIEPHAAGGYVARAVKNEAIDAHRRQTTAGGSERLVPLEEAPALLTAGDDEALVRLLDEHAARSEVIAGLRRAFADERRTVVHVVAEWLDLAERTGRAPASREVADGLGLSHTAVNQALAEFRARYLPQRGPRA
jgi:hypothetical protein